MVYHQMLRPDGLFDEVTALPKSHPREVQKGQINGAAADEIPQLRVRHGAVSGDQDPETVIFQDTAVVGDLPVLCTLVSQAHEVHVQPLQGEMAAGTGQHQLAVKLLLRQHQGHLRISGNHLLCQGAGVMVRMAVGEKEQIRAGEVRMSLKNVPALRGDSGEPHNPTVVVGKQYDPKTGQGTLGRGYCYQITPGATLFFEEPMNLFAGAGALGMCYDDFNADNFDHSDLKFIHGGVISLTQTGKRPIESNATPPGTRAWGSEFKKAAAYNFNRSLGIGAQGASIAYKANYLSLDKTYKDAYGLPLLRMTYNFTDQDRALFDYITKKIEEVAKAMNPKAMASKPSPKDYSIVPYQTTHNTGGTITGKSPEDSVVNSYLQHWDAENLFVVGAGNFPHNGGCNPTGTVGALGYRCAEGILKYSKKGGSLV